MKIDFLLMINFFKNIWQNIDGLFKEFRDKKSKDRNNKKNVHKETYK